MYSNSLFKLFSEEEDSCESDTAQKTCKSRDIWEIPGRNLRRCLLICLAFLPTVPHSRKI
jgi:hypothetical protein